MKEILYSIGRGIGGALGNAAQTLFARRRIAFSVAVLFGFIAVVLGAWTFRRADFYQRTLETVLTKNTENTENTPESYKALETLILVAAEVGPDGKQTPLKQSIEHAPIANDFGRLIHDFDTALRRTPLNAPSKPFTIAEPELANGRPPRARDAIITEENGFDDLGFLFLPARLLHIHDASLPTLGADATALAKLIGVQTEKNIDACAPNSEDLCNDVLLTRVLLPTMKAATTVAVSGTAIPGVNRTPAQVYVITENGMNRIVSAQGRDSSFYRNQFRAATVFPARPYYVGAFEKAGEATTLLGDGQGVPQGPIGDYFYVSEPYLDIGGNSIVITLARAFRYKDHRAGALCFDLKLAVEKGLSAKLATFINELDGKSAELSCEMSRQADPTCTRTRGDAEIAADTSSDLQEKLRAARNSLNVAEVIGNFTFLPGKDEGQNDPQNLSVSAGLMDDLENRILHPKDEVRFTLSTDPPLVRNVQDEDLQITFLAASLNIGHYLQNTAIAGAIALSCIAIALTIVIGSWAGEARISEAEKKQKEAEQKEQLELREALDNVSNVMLQASVPYVRLDRDDHIINANPPFAAFLGLPETPESIETRLRRTRFEDWLADQESKIEYHRVQMRREKGEKVDPYRLTFHTATGPQSRTVVSSVVPGASKGSLPETFGILV